MVAPEYNRDDFFCRDAYTAYLGAQYQCGNQKDDEEREYSAIAECITFNRSLTSLLQICLKTVEERQFGNLSGAVGKKGVHTAYHLAEGCCLLIHVLAGAPDIASLYRLEIGQKPALSHHLREG